MSGGLKRCSKCKEWLPVEMFHRAAARKDGRCDCCKYCRAESVRIDWCVRLEELVPGTDGATYADIIAQPPRMTDRTVPKVLRALRYWIADGTLTEAQATAIMLHAVDGLSWSDIGRMADMHHTTVRYHYE